MVKRYGDLIYNDGFEVDKYGIYKDESVSNQIKIIYCTYVVHIEVRSELHND